MPAPEALFTADELELAYTAEVVAQLMSAKGKANPPTDRVDLVRRSATGLVLGRVQVALQPASIDEWWDAATTTERDKAELKRLALSAASYYMRYYGQKAEEIPDAVREEIVRIEERCDAIAKQYATIGSNTMPSASAMNEFYYTTGAGNNPSGSPRSRWKNF